MRVSLIPKIQCYASCPSTERVPRAFPNCNSVTHCSLRHNRRPPHSTFLLHHHTPRNCMRRQIQSQHALSTALGGTPSLPVLYRDCLDLETRAHSGAMSLWRSNLKRRRCAGTQGTPPIIRSRFCNSVTDAVGKEECSSTKPRRPCLCLFLRLASPQTDSYVYVQQIWLLEESIIVHIASLSPFSSSECYQLHVVLRRYMFFIILVIILDIAILVIRIVIFG